MKGRHLLSGLLLLAASCMAFAAVPSDPSAAAARLHELDISAGRWVYHGHFLAHAGAHPSAWVWHEDCRWSANRVFMLCSFSNDWAGRHVDSVVVDTYDPRKDAFWHYEVFNSGRSAGKPFAVRMRIDGARRVESWTDAHEGKALRQRIVYEFSSGEKVAVRFQESSDGVHWRTTASGTGEKAADSGAPADTARAPGI